MESIHRYILMAAAAGAAGHTILGFIQLIAPSQLRRGIAGHSQEALALAIFAGAVIFMLAVLIYAGSGALFAYLARREMLPLRRMSLLGAVAAALGALVPGCFFAAINTLAGFLAENSIGGTSNQSSSVAQPVMFVLMIAGAALWAIVIGGGFGAAGAAIAANIFGKRSSRDVPAVTTS